ncbi:SAM-dependent methyltransferase [Catenulispora pinisilvae]|uniref:SAM-dependent methyltransferase n=1 Tax=Catenulispora pinisilvae TaxID=2705253 RepID=UPI002B2778F0|nr:SAM-dependent methyltransferase [Catenulispora pinisilvae]
MNNHRPAWAPSEVDIEKPSAARMYDYFLGGSHNFESNRELAEKYIEVLPDMPVIAQAQRTVLHRAVRFLATAGIDQFLDLGSGIPTAGAVHEVAREINPEARVAYVDSDPVAFAHTTAMLDDLDGVGTVYSDLRDPDSVLTNPVTAETLDLSRPVAVLMIAVLHFVPDQDDPADVVTAYRAATAPGSYLAITHATSDYRPELARRAEAVYTGASHPISYRGREQILAMLAGYELVAPGLTDMIRWRPDPQADPDPLGGDVTRYSGYAAVGRRY